MTEPMRGVQGPTPEEIAWSGVATSFAAFGRVFLCLDRQFRIVHASYVLDELAGAGTAAAVADRPIDELICGELFAEGGALRAALQAGERREGWRALVAGANGLQRFVALSAAPICPPPEVACDPRVAFAVILRPAEEDLPATLSGPSAFGITDRKSAGGLAQARRRAEAEEVRRALDAHGWRRADAALALGMSRTTLWRKMREHGFAT